MGQHWLNPSLQKLIVIEWPEPLDREKLRPEGI